VNTPEGESGKIRSGRTGVHAEARLGLDADVAQQRVRFAAADGFELQGIILAQSKCITVKLRRFA